MRHPSQFGLYGHDFRSIMFTGYSPITFFVGGTPLAGATDLLKCVVAQHEDMSHKSDIGKLRLEIRLKPPTRSGACSSSVSTQFGYVIDDSRDVKKMGALRSSAGQVGQYCAEVTITPQTLPSNGSLWAQSFCYIADEEDNAPN